MSGHLEQAAGALNAASQQVPVEHLHAAVDQLSGVAQNCQVAGGPIGQELTAETLSVQEDLRSAGARLAGLRQRLEAAATAVLRGAS